MAKIEHVRGHDGAIELLTRLKMIVSTKYRGGFLVARYGVNKRTLYKASKRLDGVR
jgi:hypothetical protein